MINWQLYVDEDLRENYFKQAGRLNNLNSWRTFAWAMMPIYFVVQEPSAQDIIDAVVEEERDWDLYLEEAELRGEEW